MNLKTSNMTVLTQQYLYVRRWCRSLSLSSCSCFKWRRRETLWRVSNKLQIYRT